jgi:DNA-binding Xre family transcriptional regulator
MLLEKEKRRFMKAKKIKWHLKELLYEKHEMNYIELCTALNKIGIQIEESTVWRYVEINQKSVSLEFLEGVMTVLGCELSDIMTIEE